MKSLIIFKLTYIFTLLNTFVYSQCPFGSSSAGAGTCVCLPGYTSTGSVGSLVCTSLCPVGSNCVVISKRTTSGDEYINLQEVELYMGTTKLVPSSLTLTLSTTYNSNTPASKCNDGVTSPSTESSCCITAGGDRNAWLLINAGSQSFSKVIVYNRIDNGDQIRINVATLTMFDGATIINPAVTFSTLGSGLETYTFYSIGFLCPAGNKCVVISKTTITGEEQLNLQEVELYMGVTKLATSSLTFTMSSTYSDASGSWSASKCNDGLTSSFTPPFLCHTDVDDRNVWLLINTGSQSFSRVVVYNRIDECQSRIDAATLTMYNGRTVTKPAVSFSSFGSGLVSYTICSTEFTGSTCISSCLANNYFNFLNNSCAVCPPGSISAAGTLESCTCLDGYASSGSGSSLVCTAYSEGSLAAPGASTCTFTSEYYNATITNLTNQITALDNKMNRINSNITAEISKIKVTLQKLSATMTRQRKREKSNIKEL